MYVYFPSISFKIGKRILSIMIIIILLFNGTLVFASTPAIDSSTPGLSSLISLALSNNPGISAAKSQADAEKQKISAAPILPDPQFMIESMNNPLGETMEPITREIEFSISQMFPFPGKLSTTLERQKANVDATNEAYEMKVTDLKKDVTLMYYGIAAMDAILAVENRKQKQLEAMGAVIAAQYTNGKATLSEFIRTNNMKTMVQTEILSMQAERARMVAELTTMLGGPIPADIVFTYNISALKYIPPENEIITKALEQFPEIHMKQAMERRMNAEARQMKLEALPDFMFRGALNQMENGDQTYSLGISIPLPIFLNYKQIPLANSALSMRDATIKERLDTENRVTQEIKARYVALTKANEALVLYQSNIQPGSKQAFEVALKDYQINRISFNELIDTFQILYDTAVELEKTKRLLIEEKVYLDFYTKNSFRWEEKP